MCDYNGRHFGASYEDACCIDGHLWDLDSGDADGLTSGGDIACPRCNTAEYLNQGKEEAESTSCGRFNTSVYCGAMLMEGSLRKAEEENPEAAARWKAENPIIETFDWPDRQAVFEGRADYNETIEI